MSQPIIMLSFTDTTGASPEVVTEKIGLETNVKNPGKSYLHSIKFICYHNIYNPLSFILYVLKLFLTSTTNTIIT